MRAHDVEIWAYCLMPNHVHLIAVPQSADGLRPGDRRGSSTLHASPDDPEPTWRQVAEIPDLAAEITEHQGHARTCPCCGYLNRGEIPPQIRAHVIGPRLAAVMSYFSGRHHLSRRAVEEVVETVFQVPISLGLEGVEPTNNHADARSASGQTVAQERIRLSQRGGMPICRADVDSGPNPTIAETSSAGFLVSCDRSSPVVPAVSATTGPTCGLNGYQISI